ncbi:truncated hemoglobin YjbI [Cytobacillus purgationiresistens]|uniref:Truncated hemoglobin YjbI n=1 Tax=Cytobacillus purgationiresistens TaxID=863449 RepID=A0ABU0AAF4_9BACI|nr:truncated hemoglobin YjbI [Cytobacillus purgationiresistens]
MEKQRRHQTKFISFAHGGPNQYNGRSMAKVHEEMNIQPEQFDTIAKHLHDALAHHAVDEQDINAAIKKVASLKGDNIYK